ncbi:Protein of unknown function DUF3347 [Spirosomataceae bacterium]|jgi:hypothetical protein
MKKIISFVIITSLFLACNSTSNSDESHSHDTDSAKAEAASIDITHQEHKGSTEKGSFDRLLTDYITLKNALVEDNSKTASEAGKTIVASLEKISKSSSKAELEILESIKENAEHIRDNTGKLDHQREHFALISKDVIDLITKSGTSKKLYQDFCPMYNDNKGTAWISETKEIKNPYYGSQMLTCGSVKKEY